RSSGRRIGDSWQVESGLCRLSVENFAQGHLTIRLDQLLSQSGKHIALSTLHTD
ncbi:hypothetical protein OF83DRAFT_1160403, partial [Amylostereum chailletii]